MATTAATLTRAGAPAGYEGGVWSWLTTVDHKRIGQLYLYTALTFFMIGGFEAELIRTQLYGPNGTFVSATTYNELFTMHGLTMIFLAIMPLSAALWNFLVPLQIGARDVAFPRLNAFSYWLFLLGGIFLNFGWLMHAAPNGGWFGYAPLSTSQFSPGLHMDFYVLGLQILGLSTLAASFNFITTIINMRAPGMHMMRMPVFTWSTFVTQFLIALSFPIITVALTFLMLDRFFGTNFYKDSAGADPLLWQHLFWLFGHPEVYILILPAFGLVSEVIPTFSRKPLFGYPVMVYSLILIATLGFGVWAHHMFAVGMGPIADSVFGITTMLIAIPTGVKIFNWLGTLWGGQLRFTTAMLFALGLVGLFTIGGISGVMHSSPPSDLAQTDSYFVVAHFHYVLFGGSMMGLFAGIYYYYPKITGRLMSEALGKVHFWGTFIGMNLTFFPMHFSGLAGMPRRIYRYEALQGWTLTNHLSTIGAYILGLATLVFIYNLIRARSAGVVAGNDPWGAPTLEWSMPSPPPAYNFAKIPVVTSRYPLWDTKSAEQIADEPLVKRWERSALVESKGNAAADTQQPPPSAEQLGIPMPTSTIKPLVAAVGLVIGFVGLLHNKSLPIMLLGGAIFVITFYSWVLTPLEPEHESEVASQ
ncbi:MAG TPA: cytochrome c oxidase subunit I [Gemmatimonadaceae bacterium]|nr:cytochrome c oxidase subunit I [Gemmatimonadaceae bacterium]